MTIRKNISLPDKQAEYVEENNINLSRFVQDRLKEDMDDRGENQE